MREQWADARSRCGSRAPLYRPGSAMLCHQHCTSASEGRRTPRAPRKATVMGNSVGSETGSTGRPGLCGTPHGPALSLCRILFHGEVSEPPTHPTGEPLHEPRGEGRCREGSGQFMAGDNTERSSTTLSSATGSWSARNFAFSKTKKIVMKRDKILLDSIMGSGAFRAFGSLTRNSKTH